MRRKEHALQPPERSIVKIGVLQTGSSGGKFQGGKQNQVRLSEYRDAELRSGIRHKSLPTSWFVCSFASNVINDFKEGIDAM
mmetsp:Transcript_49504/g.91658  ORF Transcript_49504/g.91658 Transcript_49504/m.91658 type:complete len:82 (-) Transcript_49504:235-480(-)